MNIFDLDDYREIVRARIAEMPKRGFGQLSRLANDLGVNATFVSQVLNGAKNFSEEQAQMTAELFEFTEPETVFFILLVQRERAGTIKLKSIFQKQISERLKASKKIKGRVTTEIELTFQEQAVYYSDWLYTAVHTLSSIDTYSSLEVIAEHLHVSRSKITDVANWLVEHGLCRLKGDHLTIGPRSTFVDRDSNLASRHHTNWRLRAVEKMQERKAEDFFFTAPFSVSESDFQAIRTELADLVSKIAKRVEKSDPEIMLTINVDLFGP